MAATTVSPRARRAHVEAAAPSVARSRTDSPADPRVGSSVESPAPAEQKRELRLVRPESTRTGRAARRVVFIGPVLVLLSLLAVAGAQTFLVEGQVGLTSLQAEVQAAQTKRLDLELQIANEEQPSAVMAAARQLGLIVPYEITDLPAVSLPSTMPTKPVSKLSPGNRSTQKAGPVGGAATGNRSSGAP